MLAQMWGKEDTNSLPMATNCSNTVQLGVEMPQKVKNRSIHDAAILLLGIYSKDSMSYC